MTATGTRSAASTGPAGPPEGTSEGAPANPVRMIGPIGQCG